MTSKSCPQCLFHGHASQTLMANSSKHCPKQINSPSWRNRSSCTESFWILPTSKEALALWYIFLSIVKASIFHLRNKIVCCADSIVCVSEAVSNAARNNEPRKGSSILPFLFSLILTFSKPKQSKETKEILEELSPQNSHLHYSQQEGIQRVYDGVIFSSQLCSYIFQTQCHPVRTNHFIS